MPHKSEDLAALVDKSSAAAPRSTTPRTSTEGKLFARERLRLLLDDDAQRLRRGRPARQQRRARSAGRRRRHRPRQDPRPHRRRHGQRLDRQGRLVGRAHRREDRAHPGDAPARSACRSSTSSTRPARASPIRSTCSPAAATPGASSTTRCTCRARCRRSACCSARRPPAAPTSRRSATSSSWSRRTPRCTSARRAWPRWSSARRSRSRRWAARACTARSRAAATCSPRPRPSASPPRAPICRICRRAPARSRPPPRRARRAPASASTRSCRPTTTRRSTSHEVIDALVDEGSFFEMKKLFARELVTGFARVDGEVVGIVASQPKWKGGVLFVDSADKAARFIWLCDAFEVPLVFLADVPGFMIGKAVERQGIIRHGAKMISAVVRRHRAQVLRGLAQGLRRRAVRHVRPRLRARRDAGAAAGVDRRHGARGGGQRGLLQQDPGEARGGARRLRREPARAVPRRTSTSTSWPPSCTSTPSSPATSCAASCVRRLEAARHKRTHRWPRKRAGPARLASPGEGARARAVQDDVRTASRALAVLVAAPSATHADATLPACAALRLRDSRCAAPRPPS